ncbi:hypothetical protein NIIDMKKI_23210 [Mycobacterium kansasii]|uniref:Metalloprotease TldD/E C-terminal domain-containing protein n=1 Tax=Mycobacterium kansasii TaxID=1768 RepID=A0A7G1IBL6_MYCKA|nr:hypothetical protein NIIDMKKI_23210 [Mycobacterium kansasii]
MPVDWDAPISRTGVEAFAGVAASLSREFAGSDRLYGYAHHSLSTTFLASSTGLRRRYTQPAGAVEINVKRGDASAWAGVGLPTSSVCQSMCCSISCRRGWGGRNAGSSCPGTVRDHHAAVDGGRHDAVPVVVDGRPRGTGGPHRAVCPRRRDHGGERLTELPLTLFSDPMAPGLACRPFVAVSNSSETLSVFDNGMDVGHVDWIRDGVINALAYPRATAAKYDAPVAVAAENLLMTGGSAGLAEMIAATERGLLLTTLWYIREVDPTTLLLTGLTRDGVYLIEDGAVTAAVNNFRFNESPLDLLRRATEAGVSEVTLPREWANWATRAAMPSLRIPDFHMSSVSQAQ